MIMSNDQFNNAGGQAPPKKKNTLLIVLGVLGALFLVAAIGCCGVVYWTMGQANALITEAVKTELMGSAAVEEHFGEIKETSMSIVATGEVQQSEGDKNLLVMDVTGTKGDGQLILKQGPNNTFTDIRIRLPDGTIIPATDEDTLDFDPGSIDAGTIDLGE